jgi:hypothetical protein
MNRVEFEKIIGRKTIPPLFPEDYTKEELEEIKNEIGFGLHIDSKGVNVIFLFDEKEGNDEVQQSVSVPINSLPQKLKEIVDLLKKIDLTEIDNF